MMEITYTEEKEISLETKEGHTWTLQTVGPSPEFLSVQVTGHTAMEPDDARQLASILLHFAETGELKGVECSGS